MRSAVWFDIPEGDNNGHLHGDRLIAEYRELLVHGDSQRHAAAEHYVSG
jgi:hypothetical protein